jgi:hypothetical protein
MKKHSKKHHTTKRTHRSPRRMGAAPGELNRDVMQVAGILAAAVGGGMIKRQLTAVNPKIISAAELVAGFMLKRTASSGFMEGLSWGLIGDGAITLTHETGIIRGLDDLVSGISDNGEYMMGIRNDQLIGGVRNDQYIGAPETETADPEHKTMAQLFHAEGLNG